MAPHPIYGKFPFTIINNFVAADLESNALMPKTVIGKDGQTYPTMIPGGQTPEITESTDSTVKQHPFVLYGIEEDESQDSPYKACESITYVINGPTVQRVGEILYCIYDLMARKDWSVKDLNDFALSANSKFHFIDVTFETKSGFEPLKTEGGRYAAMIAIHYEYTYDINGVPGSAGQGRRI